jgi:tetratricopeptide (TPR) repeat protein
MLETIREYALDMLEAAGEASAARWAHSAYFLALAEQAEPDVWGPRQVAVLRRLQEEHYNFRAALAWVQGNGDDPVTALRLATALVQFWIIRGHLSELAALEAALDATRRGPDDAETSRTRATALHWLANAIRYRGDQARCVALCEESVVLFRSIDDREGLAMALSNLGFMLRDLPDYPRARACAEQGVIVAREVNNWRILGWTLFVQASIIWFDRYLGQGAQTPFDPDFDAGADRDAADDEARATSLLDESLAIFRQHGETHYVAVVLSGGGSLGAWAWARGDFALAAAAYAEAIRLHQRVGSLREVADCLRQLAWVAMGDGQTGRAARLIGADHAAHEALGRRHWSAYRPLISRGEAAIRACLSKEEFDVAWAEGRAMTLEQAVAYALGEPAGS